VLGLPVLVACFAVEAQEAVELEAQQITAPRETERGNGPVEGYVAKRSVNATKTDTPIIETPQSISVITADRIRDQGSLTIQDSLRYVAGMRGEAYGFDSRGDFSLGRGVSPTIFLDGLQQSVGSYTNTRTDPFTLERIEVLKGPSSMLYGQSSVGGLLSLVSKRPQAEQKNELQLQYGSFDRKQIAFDSTGTLDDDGTGKPSGERGRLSQIHRGQRLGVVGRELKADLHRAVWLSFVHGGIQRDVEAGDDGLRLLCNDLLGQRRQGQLGHVIARTGQNLS